MKKFTTICGYMTYQLKDGKLKEDQERLFDISLDTVDEKYLYILVNGLRSLKLDKTRYLQGIAISERTPGFKVPVLQAINNYQLGITGGEGWPITIAEAQNYKDLIKVVNILSRMSVCKKRDVISEHIIYDEKTISLIKSLKVNYSFEVEVSKWNKVAELFKESINLLERFEICKRLIVEGQEKEIKTLYK